MSTNSIINIRLSDVDRENLRKEFSHIHYDSSGKDLYIQEIRKTIYRTLPRQIIDIFNNQRGARNLQSGIIIDNIPIDDNITGSPNFDQTGKEFKSGVISENILTAFSLLVGEPYSIYFEGKELVNNLTPQANQKNAYTGLGSEVELDFHIENAALQFISEDDYAPVGLFLLGIRIDENIEPPKTFIADARKALKLLNPSDLDILYGNNFYLSLPHRWRNAFHHSKINTSKCPVIRGSLDLPRISVAFYPNMVTAIDNRSKLALSNFHQAIQETSEPISITPGKLVYVDNRFTLHSRSKFTPTYDTNGYPYRWLQRVFVASNLWPFRHFQSVGHRVFLPKELTYSEASTSM
jgi:hypothetical protein